MSLFVYLLVFFFFFFKQKTAYEMLISDWSSDVCSSDLARPRGADRHRRFCDHHGRALQVLGDQPAGGEDRIEIDAAVGVVRCADREDDDVGIGDRFRKGGGKMQTAALMKIGRAHV